MGKSSFFQKIKNLTVVPLAEVFSHENKISLQDKNKSNQLFSQDATYGFIKYFLIWFFLVFSVIPVFKGIDSPDSKIVTTQKPLEKFITMSEKDMEIMFLIGTVNFQNGLYDFSFMAQGQGNDYTEFIKIVNQKNENYVNDPPPTFSRMQAKKCSDDILKKFLKQNLENMFEYEYIGDLDFYATQTLKQKSLCFSYKNARIQNNKVEIIQIVLHADGFQLSIDTTCDGHGWDSFDWEDFYNHGVGQNGYVCDPYEYRDDGQTCCGDGKVLYDPTTVTKVQIDPYDVFKDAMQSENDGTSYPNAIDTSVYKKGISLFGTYLQESLTANGFDEEVITFVIPFSQENSINIDLQWKKNTAIMQNFPLFPMTTSKKTLFEWTQSQTTFFGNSAFLAQVSVSINKGQMITTLTAPTVDQVISPLGGFITGIMILLAFLRNNISGYDLKKQIEQHYKLLKTSQIDKKEFQAKKILIQTPKIDVLAEKQELFYEQDLAKKLEENQLKLQEAKKEKEKYLKEKDLIDKYLDKKLIIVGQQEIQETQDYDNLIDSLRTQRVALNTILGEHIYSMVKNFKEPIVIDDENFRQQIDQKNINVNDLESLQFEKDNQLEMVQVDEIKLIEDDNNVNGQIILDENDKSKILNNELTEEQQFEKLIESIVDKFFEKKVKEINFDENLQKYFLKNFQKQMDDHLKPIKLKIK